MRASGCPDRDMSSNMRDSNRDIALFNKQPILSCLQPSPLFLRGRRVGTLASVFLFRGVLVMLAFVHMRRKRSCAGDRSRDDDANLPDAPSWSSARRVA